ncbi:TauD/TfdA family dioxygenase [Sphaerisporangium sp. NPDC051017]|uniref:TauD/TfdA family dioxygenase n=1 Tax=unclassified Sphaerisporangium TaxID=2630420 RepID=UPI00340821AF
MSQDHATRIALAGPSLHQQGTGPWQPATVTVKTEHQPVDVLDWTRAHLRTARCLLTDYGAFRLRGTVTTTQTFGQTVALIADAPLLEYLNRSTPRSRIKGKVFTSTEYRSDQAIHMHSEQSYAATWPAVLGFWCITPATSRGETPLASTADVLDRLPADLVSRFQAHGVRYDRWYRPGLDVPWTDTFQTEHRAKVDRLCAETGITTEWHDDGTVLHTVHTAQATHAHPGTGRKVWLNQANLFHPAALPDDIAAAVRDLPEDHLPRNACFGDGTAIPHSDITTINDTFTACSWAEPWQQGDLLLVDNTAVAHGRRPYQGQRQVLVAMAGTAQ